MKKKEKVCSLQEDVKKAGNCGARTREVGRVATGRGHQDGLPGGPTHCPVQFRTRNGTVEGMWPSYSWNGTICQSCRIRAIAKTESASSPGFSLHQLFGSVEPQHHRQKRGNGWLVAQRRSIFCFSQDGDNDRKRRFESSKWQSIQPIA